MISRHDTNDLLHTLHDLYVKICTFDFIRRVRSYRNITESGVVADISVPMKRYIDRLVAKRKPAATTGRAKAYTNALTFQPVSFRKVLSGLAGRYKIAARKNELDLHMGEKLKNSTWSHINASFMHARAGDVANAKLHADIANQALKESVHYMRENDYKSFCQDVDKALNELNGVNK